MLFRQRGPVTLPLPALENDMAGFDHTELRAVARRNKAPIRFYLGGGDSYHEDGKHTSGPASVTVLPYGRTKIVPLTYRMEDNR